MTNGPYSVYVFFSTSTYFYLRPNNMFRITVFKHVYFLFVCNNKGPNLLLTQKKTSTFVHTGKGKAVPLQAWTGPEVSRKLRSSDFVTTVQDGGKVVSLTHPPPLPPGNTPGTHFC